MVSITCPYLLVTMPLDTLIKHIYHHRIIPIGIVHDDDEDEAEAEALDLLLVTCY